MSPTKLLRVLVFMSGLASAGLVSAADISLPDFVVWSNADNSNTGIRVEVAPGYLVNPGSCSNTDSYFVLTTLSEQTQSRTLAVLLAAKALGRSVTVRVIGCEANRPAIVGAYF
jgi:hypothetical protein